MAERQIHDLSMRTVSAVEMLMVCGIEIKNRYKLTKKNKAQ